MKHAEKEGAALLLDEFDYGANEHFPRLKEFGSPMTLVYVPFPLPKLYVWKTIFFYGTIFNLILSLGFVVKLGRKIIR